MVQIDYPKHMNNRPMTMTQIGGLDWRIFNLDPWPTLAHWTVKQRWRTSKHRRELACHSDLCRLHSCTMHRRAKNIQQSRTRHSNNWALPKNCLEFLSTVWVSIKSFNIHSIHSGWMKIPRSLHINHHEGTEKLLNSEVGSISNWGSARICWS